VDDVQYNVINCVNAVFVFSALYRWLYMVAINATNMTVINLEKIYNHCL